MRGVLLFTSLLVLVIGLATSENIYFNTSVTGCEKPIGCNWDDPAIWIGGVVPRIYTDSVYLNDTRPNIYVILNSTVNNFFLELLHVSGVTLGLFNTSIVLQNLAIANGTLSLEQNSLIDSYQNIIITNNSTITLFNASILSLEASALQFVLDQTSYLYAGPATSLLLSNLVAIYGVLETDSSSTFEGGSVVFWHRTVSFDNIPVFQSAIFKLTANGTFQNGLYSNSINLDSGSFVTIYNILGAVQSVEIQDGSALYLRSISTPTASIASFSPFTGTLVVSSSQITIKNAFNTLNTNLIIGGRVYITFSAITIKQLTFTTGENKEDPYAYIQVNGDPVYFQGVQIPGQVEIDNSFVSFSGGSSITGGIQSLAGTLVIEGKFTAGGPIVMVTEEPYYPFTSLQSFAEVTTPFFHIQPVTELQNNDRSIIFGNVRNEGILSNVGTDTLTIIGNYTQTEGGILTLNDIDPLSNNTGFINATGPAYIAGTVAYSIYNTTTHEGEVKFPILFASEVHGKFLENLRNDGLGNTSVRLEYSNTSINFVYGAPKLPQKHHEKFLGLEWWSWLLITLAGVLVFVVFIPCTYYRLRVRGRYEPIVEELSP